VHDYGLACFIHRIQDSVVVDPFIRYKPLFFETYRLIVPVHQISIIVTQKVYSRLIEKTINMQLKFLKT
jgi:hypothetical protein